MERVARFLEQHTITRSVSLEPEHPEPENLTRRSSLRRRQTHPELISPNGQDNINKKSVRIQEHQEETVTGIIPEIQLVTARILTAEELEEELAAKRAIPELIPVVVPLRPSASESKIKNGQTHDETSITEKNLGPDITMDLTRVDEEKELKNFATTSKRTLTRVSSDSACKIKREVKFSLGDSSNGHSIDVVDIHEDIDDSEDFDWEFDDTLLENTTDNEDLDDFWPKIDASCRSWSR